MVPGFKRPIDRLPIRRVVLRAGSEELHNVVVAEGRRRQRRRRRLYSPLLSRLVENHTICKVVGLTPRSARVVEAAPLSSQVVLCVTGLAHDGFTLFFSDGTQMLAVR